MLALSRLEYAVAFDQIFAWLAAASRESGERPARLLAVASTPEFLGHVLARAESGVCWLGGDLARQRLGPCLAKGLLPRQVALSTTVVDPAAGGATLSPFDAAIWASPQPGTWRPTLAAIARLLAREARLYVLLGTRIGRLARPLRAAEAPGEPAAVEAFARELARLGWRRGRVAGLGGLASLGWGLAGRAAALLHRDDLADRAERAHHQAVGDPWGASYHVVELRRPPAQCRTSTVEGPRGQGTARSSLPARSSATLQPEARARSVAPGPSTVGLQLCAARLERWLETMRAPGGYGGPVAHWWRDSLLYCGAGHDWRYEGVLRGYLELFRVTGEPAWLARARRCGDDLLAAQLPQGNFTCSSFEANPRPGGTPHEASVDVALLALARALRDVDDPAWSRYLEAAHGNLERFYVGRLWDDQVQAFRDDPARPSFVPNKSATLVEALLLCDDLVGGEEWGERYARPTLAAILGHQVRRAGPLHGAIAQNSFGARLEAKYFPLYVARCVPALLRGAARWDDRRLLEAALAAGEWVLRWRDEDGGLPQVVYADGRLNRHPRWVAAVGDVLRALDLLRAHGLEGDLEPTRAWLLDGQLPNGAFRTARGFAGDERPGPADARDLLPVVGWNDKAFRYLAARVSGPLPEVEIGSVEEACTWHGRPARYYEDATVVEVLPEGGGPPFYRWRKGETWAEPGPQAQSGG